jgi:hypothetical protein
MTRPQRGRRRFCHRDHRQTSLKRPAQTQAVGSIDAEPGSPSTEATTLSSRSHRDRQLGPTTSSGRSVLVSTMAAAEPTKADDGHPRPWLDMQTSEPSSSSA